MSFYFLDDIALADIAFEVEGQSLEDIFKESSQAFLHIQINNPEDLRFIETLHIKKSHKEPDLLLYQFLQELVYYKDVDRLLLVVKDILIEPREFEFKLSATLQGEPLDPSRHDQRADVKAVTFHKLSVEKTDQGWHALVVVDV